MSMFITLGERQQSMAPGENRYTDYLQEKFDVSFDLTVVPGEARLEKQNLLLASGTYPDIFFDGQFSPADQMKYGGQGVLIPINDLIANHGPDIEKAWGDPAGAGEVDGDPGRQHLQHSGGGGVLPLQREPEALDQHHLAGQARPRHARHHRRVRGGADGVPG